MKSQQAGARTVPDSGSRAVKHVHLSRARHRLHDNSSRVHTRFSKLCGVVSITSIVLEPTDKHGCFGKVEKECEDIR